MSQMATLPDMKTTKNVRVVILALAVCSALLSPFRWLYACFFGSTCALCKKPYLWSERGYVSHSVGGEYLTCKACETKHAETNRYWKTELHKHYANIGLPNTNHEPTAPEMQPKPDAPKRLAP
jgi:hypothetical protein